MACGNASILRRVLLAHQCAHVAIGKLECHLHLFQADLRRGKPDNNCLRSGKAPGQRDRDDADTIQVTPNELIAIGHLIYTYRLRLKSTSNYMQEQRELLALLESFQRRVAGPTRTALDLSAAPQPWQKNSALPRSSSRVADISGHILRWIGLASQRVIARLKNFFLLAEKASHKGS
jgi:hypothetical protein